VPLSSARRTRGASVLVLSLAAGALVGAAPASADSSAVPSMNVLSYNVFLIDTMG
jgi:hypothetical protein